MSASVSLAPGALPTPFCSLCFSRFSFMGARAIEFLLLCIHNKLGIGISPIPSGADDDRSQRFTRQNDLHPITWCLIVAIDLSAVLCCPFEIRSNVVVRRVLQLLLIHVDHLAGLLFTVLQCPPWQWVVFLAHAEKTTEGHDCVDRS